MFTVPDRAIAPQPFAAAPVAVNGLQGLNTAAIAEPDRFVILAGEPFSGKTTSAVGLQDGEGFPNPLLLNFDNKNPRPGIAEIPFHNDDFIESIVKRKSTRDPVNRQDAFTIWLADNARYCKDYTGILDGLGTLEIAFHQQTADVEKIQGINGGLLYGRKLKYLNGCMALLAAYFRRVVVTCHLAPVYTRDEKTGIDVNTGRHRPMVGGQFAERIAGFATSNILCKAVPKDPLAMDGKLRHIWLLRPTAEYNSRTLLTGDYPNEIEASYKVFKSYFPQPT